MRQDIEKMSVATRKVIRIGATSKFLALTDVGSGSLIVASKIIARRDTEIDLHARRSK